MRQTNGEIWKDTKGQDIQAHGGMIMEHQDIYYWYGENKAGANRLSSIGGQMVDFIGISCYHSSNLTDWYDDGLVLTPESLASLKEKVKIVERPKVIYNKKMQKFVLWFHYDHDDYSYAAAGVATSSSPTGPFELVKVFHPNRKDVRDMTLYQENEKAYLIHSSDFNKTMVIAELTDDYLDVTGLYTKILVDQEREAPAIFRTKDYYFMITSGTTGWKPNEALVSRSTHLNIPAKILGNPLTGKDYRKTFFGQSTYIFQKDNQFYLMLDHWKSTDLRHSGYSILPIVLSEDGKDVTIPWTAHPFETA
ncbi:glycosyl hydrolase family 43 [Lactococcus lactis]|uniref:glycoside hydrolase family 43 protein n=1 Tax=Lactococcus lactis TaxID=1358 RepID=UPI0021A72FB9|nr:glycoside hydrolase family 43 protein [Lactococcus lactis]MCT3091782.1 glycosyl hydrolase family 43 [Lactococcus lactis]